MNRDEARKILGEGATEEQVTNLLNSFHNAEKVKNDKIAQLESQLNNVSDYDDIKKQLDDINKANLSREEQIALKEKEAEQKLANASIILNTTKAKEILSGFDLDDETISMLVSDDEAKTINNATKLKEKFDSLKENVAKETKETLTNVDLTPSITNVNQNEKDEMTIEKFMNLSSEEQEKFINENPEKFENL
ncbi:MAG: hypothetical protein J6C46_08575 [Clostridia bacterium]|nr:hypothetical protein [Clostridia bacterium]